MSVMHTGNTGYEVSGLGIQNSLDFWLRVQMIIGKSSAFLSGLIARSQKMGNFDFQNFILIFFLFLNFKLHT